MAKPKYDCLKCVGYCCAIYGRVSVRDTDVRRLAKHFKVTPEVAERRYTKMYGDERVLRRSADPIFGESCMFQDPERRICTIYDARPKTCRDWPTHGQAGHCVYYDILEFERRQQEDPDYVPLVHIELVEGAGSLGAKKEE
ncbi:MAG: YkgJ family cysteine cluster protein [Bacteroidetes bacterium]|nr:YkgJ family cysteine cluster protein [Bacteroidota bacterium]